MVSSSQFVGMALRNRIGGSRGHNQVRNVEANQSIPEIQSDGSYFFPLVNGRTPPRRNPNFESIRNNAIEITATGIDALTVSPVFNTR